MINVVDYITNSKYYKTYKVDDLLFVEYKCRFGGESVSYWTHNNYFAYILGGKTKYVSGKNEYVVQQGDALFVRRGAYVAHVYGKGDYCALLIFVPDEFIKTVLDKYPGPLRLSGEIQNEESDSMTSLTMDESLSAYFHSVLSYFSKDISPSRELLKIKFEELLLNVLTSHQNHLVANSLRQIHDTGKVSIRHIMETSFIHHLSLEEYARMCARSLTAFKADFYELYGTTPGKWLIRRRLEHAKLLMETTDESVNDIAYKSGFINTTHFVKVFKEQYGMPPLQHRLNRKASALEPMEL